MVNVHVPETEFAANNADLERSFVDLASSTEMTPKSCMHQGQVYNVRPGHQCAQESLIGSFKFGTRSYLESKIACVTQTILSAKSHRMRTKCQRQSTVGDSYNLLPA